MISLLFLLIGIGIGQAYREIRTREVKRALDASQGLFRVACDLNAGLNDELVIHKKILAQVKAFACRAHVERLQSLGGVALLPVPTKPSVGQRSSHRFTAALPGPSTSPRPRF